MSERYLLVYIPDLLLKEGQVSYFNKHKADFRKLNNREKIVVPFSVYKEIDKYIIIHVLKDVPAPVEKVKVAEEVIEETFETQEGTSNVLTASLLDELVGIKGIGQKTAESIVEICNNDKDALIKMLKTSSLEIRDDYMAKLDEYFSVD